MRMRSSHKLVLGFLAAITLTAGCTAEQRQRVRDTMDVADRAIKTTQQAMETAEKGAKLVACLRDKPCPQGNRSETDQHD
jgi:hypothetical protein